MEPVERVEEVNMGKKRQDSVGPQAQFLGWESNTQGSRVCGLMSKERKRRRGS